MREREDGNCPVWASSGTMGVLTLGLLARLYLNELKFTVLTNEVDHKYSKMSNRMKLKRLLVKQGVLVLLTV